MRRSWPVISGVSALALGLLSLTAAAPASAAPAAGAAPAGVSTAPESVIVVLRHQYTFPGTVAGARERVAAGNAAQAPVLASLRASHATAITQLHLVDAVAATVSPAEVTALRADSQVAAVVPNASFRGPAQPAATAAATARAAKLTPGICPPKGHVQLNPEGAELVKAFSGNGKGRTARSLGFTGKGVTVGDIAVGINPAEKELIRPDGQHVIKVYKDFTGEGTKVYGGEDLESYLDDSVMAAQGRLVYDLHDFNPALPKGCDIRIEGVAPGMTLDAYKVYGNEDETTTSAFLEAIDYAVDVSHVNVLNEEGGSFPMPDTSQDLIKTANAAAMAAGVTITSPSYDAGPESTIWSPSSQPGVISVGASTAFRSYAQGDVGEYSQVKARGWVSDNISALSSGGFTEGGRTIDVLAPGDLDWIACGGDKPACGTTGNSFTLEGGTSEAGPIVAAVAALVDQAYRSTHHGATPSVAVVRDIISSSATDLDMPAYEEGSGLVDAYRAIEAALAYHGARSHHGTGPDLVASVQQLAAAGRPGAAVTQSFRLTNTGTATAKVSLGTRTTGDQTLVAHATLHRTKSSADQVFTFRLRRYTPVLTADIASPGGPESNPVALTLVNPQGKLAAYTLPQGTGNHGQVEVRQASAGVWKADVSSLGSYSGPVYVGVYAAPLRTWGSVSPAHLRLAPGASARVTLRTKLRATAGDKSAAVTFAAAGFGHGSLPVTLRSLVPVSHGSGHFSATLIGGNGRGFVPAQTFFYQVQVPAGKPALDVQARLAGSNDDPYFTYLIDPQGEAVAQASNQVVTGESGGEPVVTGEPGARLHVLAPQPGRWTVIITFTNPVTGNRLQTPLTGTVSYAPIKATATGLPGAAGTTLARGKQHVVKVKVTNTGDAAEAYFLDARTNQVVTTRLSPVTPATSLTLPATDVFPEWIVPTQTTSLTARAVSTAPTTFDFSPLNGEPDLGARVSGDDAAASVTAPAGTDLTQGVWDILPQQVGPFGAAGAKKSTTSLTLTARTRAFDPALSSATGDLWEQGAAADAAFAPVLVQPGATTTLTATITPTQKVGTVVRGVLYLDDSSALTNEGESPSGDQLIAIPYAYTVGK